MSSAGKANAVLAAAVLFLLLSSCGAYFAFERLRISEGWVHHTLDVQHSLDRFSTAAGRAGRLRSEYVESGDPAMLSRQAGAAVDVRNSLSAIQQLTADNVNQQINWEKLARLTERRLGLMDQALELKRSGKSTPESQAPINREMMAAADDTETVVNAMAAEEQR